MLESMSENPYLYLIGSFRRIGYSLHLSALWGGKYEKNQEVEVQNMKYHNIKSIILLYFGIQKDFPSAI